tara:strand:+ start:90 stop:1319 length:1230 start_codon:yes stop_codon:yes gene_type:complete
MNKSNSNKTILDCIENIIGESSINKPIHLHEPDFINTNAWDYVKDCIDNNWVSSAGEWVNKFEKMLCQATNAKNAIAVNNGTNALRLALHLVGVEPGDEVLLPPLSFVATANAIAHLGAIPHFIDIEPETLGLDPNAISQRLKQITQLQNGKLVNKETGRTISAVVAVHVFGHPANTPELINITNQWNLPLVEDAAAALGSWRYDASQKIHCGLFGAVGTLSFNGNKLVTTGGGGALITNCREIANKARHLSTTAKSNHPWDYHHDSVAWNDRLPNINAALGVAQLETLHEIIINKRQLVKNYIEVFKELKNIELIQEPKDCKSNYWLATLRFLSKDSSEANLEREKVLKAAHSKGLLIRPAWQLLNTLPMYKTAPTGSLTVAYDQSSRLLNLPSSCRLLNKRNEFYSN